MYKVVILKDNDVIRVEDNMQYVILTGMRGSKSPQIIEGVETTATIVGTLEMMKHSVLEQM